ncbi:MAG TPA: ATP-binding protein [Asticcacaulis sp.]|nr:ATP-binding protein [Asticcacaulis sp.]
MTLTPSPASASIDTVLLDYGLKAQARMLPYTMGFFGVGLPIFLWSAHLSVSSWMLAFYLLLFSINWPIFMILRSQAEKRVELGLDGVPARLWRQGIGGALWTAALLIICLTAVFLRNGPVTDARADVLLMICAGAAVGIVFFSAPVMIHLLVMGPLAVAGPMLAMTYLHQGAGTTNLVIGGLTLTLAMGFVLNRQMREHYLLQYKQLETAREREDLTLAKMALMETLSREIKSGLAGIEQALLKGQTHLSRAPAPRQYVDAALSEVEHLQSILITTLDNDTAAAGQIEVNVQPFDAERLCQRLMNQFGDLARGKDLLFSFTTQDWPEDGTPGATIGDEYRVEQVVAHMLSNALLYTQQGRIELRLMTTSDTWARIEVVDSGPGLNEEELEQAFAPHVRIARTSAGHSGAGLGLSLSRSLAELMGGRMGAESTPDVGSKFWLDLPFDALQASPETPADTPTETEAAGHALRVLLLTNDSLRAAQLRDQLEHLGHKCLTSTSRERALALAKKGGIDACVISTGAFENLSDEDNRRDLESFLKSLRATQAEARLNILALLPSGDQAEDLQALGVKPLLLPQNRESLARALAQD